MKNIVFGIICFLLLATAVIFFYLWRKEVKCTCKENKSGTTNGQQTSSGQTQTVISESLTAPTKGRTNLTTVGGLVKI